MKISVQFRGLQEVEKLLTEIAPKHANNIIRTTVGGVAGVVRDEAKSRVPVVSGDLKKSIKIKRRKGRPGYFRTDVVVLRTTGFYWRFLEYGTSNGTPEHSFFLKALQAVEGELPTILNEQFIKKFTAKLARERKKQI